jgi:hypothetical protein
MEYGYQEEKKKGPTHPQRNKRVSTRRFMNYEDAAEFKAVQRKTGTFSKVKVFRRSNIHFDVASYVPLETSDD